MSLLSLLGVKFRIWKSCLCKRNDRYVYNWGFKSLANVLFTQGVHSTNTLFAFPQVHNEYILSQSTDGHQKTSSRVSSGHWKPEMLLHQCLVLFQWGEIPLHKTRYRYRQGTFEKYCKGTITLGSLWPFGKGAKNALLVDTHPNVKGLPGFFTA